MQSLINLLQWIPGYSGFGSYIQRVVPSLPGLRLQFDSHGKCSLIDQQNWLIENPPNAPKAIMRLLQRLSLVQHGLSISQVLSDYGLKKSDIGVIYSPFCETLIELASVPQIITCPDLTPVFSSGSKRSLWRYKYWLPIHLAISKKIITYSKYVADQLLEIGVKSSQIEVIPCGVNVVRQRIENPRSNDLLLIARHDTNKNIPYILKGIGKFQINYPEWDGKLRIIGRSGRTTKIINRLIEQIPRPGNVELIETITPLKLIEYMRSSFALISSSTQEGFDYPILEAKAEGLPTLISDINVHREFHYDSSLFFAIDDEQLQFVFALKRLFAENMLWNQISKKGFELANSMSIDKQCREINNQIQILSTNNY